MAKIRISIVTGKNKYGKDKKKTIDCDVADIYCRYRLCLNPGQFQHRGAIGGGATKSSGVDNFYSCMQRNYHGCPSDKNTMAKIKPTTPKGIIQEILKLKD